MDVGKEACYVILDTDEIVFCEGQIELKCHRSLASPYRLVIIMIILGLVAPDR